MKLYTKTELKPFNVGDKIFYYPDSFTGGVRCWEYVVVDAETAKGVSLDAGSLRLDIEFGTKSFRVERAHPNFKEGKWAYAGNPTKQVTIITTELEHEFAPVLSHIPQSGAILLHRLDGSPYPLSSSGNRLVPLQEGPREIYLIDHGNRVSLSAYTEKEMEDLLFRDKSLKFIKFAEVKE